MIKLGITAGDINGIGTEIILKALSHYRFHSDCKFYYIGPASILLELQRKLHLPFKQPIEIIEPDINYKEIDLEYGKPTKTSGEISYQSMITAINLAKNSKLDAIITPPISKAALNMANHNFSGHTEILQHFYPNSTAQMLFATDYIKLLLLTRHIPVKDIHKSITKELIIENILQLEKTLKINFNSINPTIAICSLNPHAGESGTIGKEETEILEPAINILKQKNINIKGPFPSDSIWKYFRNYNCIVALYHDQGLIPIKLLCGDKLVNVTCGLPLIRTSPCHGTAYDIAEKFIASETSLVEAIKLARDIYINRNKSNLNYNAFELSTKQV